MLLYLNGVVLPCVRLDTSVGDFEGVRFEAKPRGPLSQTQLVRVDLEGLRLVLKVMLQTLTDVLQAGKLVISRLALIFQEVPGITKENYKMVFNRNSAASNVRSE